MSPSTTATGPDRLVVATTTLLVVTAGVVVVAGVLAATAGRSTLSIADPGPLTTTGLPLARYLQDVLGTLVVGCALLPVLQPAGPEAPLARRSHALLAPAALAWGAVTGVVYLLTASDLSGRSVPRILAPDVQQLFLTLPQARAQLLVVVAAVMLVVASRTRAGEDPWVARGLLLVATAGLLPPAFVGHSAAAADHETAVGSVSLHLVAGALWVGGLAVLAVLVLADARVRPADALPTVRAFSTLALGCVVVVGASGVLNGALRVRPEDLLGTVYGVLLVVKTLALAVLVGLGWWHRRRSIAAMAAGGRDAGRAAFLRLVVVELAVMALTVAAAVVLARTPPPGLGG